MALFKPNDAVFILPRYVRLYPGHTAVVTGVTADPFRPMFNEYALEFPDGSREDVFEFQIIEDVFNYRTLIASLVFDSRRHPPAQQARGFDLDMTFRATTSSVSTMGQVLERGTKSLLKNLEVRLMKESTQIATTMSDSRGIFKFSNAPGGSLNILVVIRQYSLRILGGFWL
jgi:hypothetical protein